MLETRRRDFLGLAAMAGASLAVPGLCRVRAEDPVAAWQPKQALSSVMFSELALEAFCSKASELGFKAIDLWSPFANCRHMHEAVKLGADGFAKLLQKHGLQLGVWTTYRTKDHDQGFPGFADFIGACGGGIVVRESSYKGTRKDRLEESFRRFFGELEPEIELARKHKVRLAIENHAYTILDSPESFEIFSRLNPAPDVVGVGVAPYHLQKRKADVAEVIRVCGKQLLFFYAWQLADGTKQFPGIGPADFTPWLQALADVDYQHWMTPFMHGDLPQDEMAAAVSKAFNYLNTLKLES